MKDNFLAQQFELERYRRELFANLNRIEQLSFELVQKLEQEQRKAARLKQRLEQEQRKYAQLQRDYEELRQSYAEILSPRLKPSLKAMDESVDLPSFLKGGNR